jgi:hypothetical protein
MSLYVDQQFEHAISLFNDILITDPDDQTVQLFLESAARYLLEGVPENWTGAEEMLSK